MTNKEKNHNVIKIAVSIQYTYIYWIQPSVVNERFIAVDVNMVDDKERKSKMRISCLKKMGNEEQTKIKAVKWNDKDYI